MKRLIVIIVLLFASVITAGTSIRGRYGGTNVIKGASQGTLLFWADILQAWVPTETNELFWDDVNKRFGIGTATPLNKLHIDGEIGFVPRAPVALVSFIFDDGNDTDYDVMKPVFDAQGEVACSALVTNFMNQAGNLTTAQALELQTAGWEILSHTVTHPDLTGLTEAELHTELGGSKTILEGLGFTVRNFVCPGGLDNVLVRRIERTYYRSARGGGIGVNQRMVETFHLVSRLADDHTLLTTYQSNVDTAETNERWLIFYIHDTDANDATTIGSLIDYIQGKGISIVTVNQALNLIGNYNDTGEGFALGEQGFRGKAYGTFSIVAQDNSDQIDIHHDTSDAYIKWTDGTLILETDEGDNTNTNVFIRGKGSGRGYLYVYDEDNGEYVSFRSSDGRGFLTVGGTSPVKLALQQEADIPITMFEAATAGETPELKIYGYKSGDASRSLEIGVGVDAADTVSFDGLSNYLFDGNIQSTGGAQLGDGGTTNYLGVTNAGNVSFNGLAKITGLKLNTVAKTGAYTATATDDVITCGAGNETFTIDLPAVVDGKVFYIKNVGTGTITVDANTTGSTTIDGANTKALAQFEFLQVIADASVYWAI